MRGLGKRVEIDNRGLPPPEPLLRVLEALSRLDVGDELVVCNDRRPLFLYPELEERGLAHETEALEDGSFRITIRRREGRG